MKPLLCALISALLAGCAQVDNRHVMHISVADQRLVLTDNGKPVADYPISTSKFCVSSAPNSYGTPLGKHRVAKKIGGGLPQGAVLKSRRFTGEVLAVDAPGRDPIVTRILWLRGTESRNRNSFARCIYIHGTPEERNIGRPASYGCIRMRSRDVAALYGRVGLGARVDIFAGPMAERFPQYAVVQPSGATPPAPAATPAILAARPGLAPREL